MVRLPSLDVMYGDVWMMGFAVGLARNKRMVPSAWAVGSMKWV
jgi:hypothetical protein